MTVLTTSYFFLFICAIIALIFYTQYLTRKFKQDIHELVPLLVIVPSGLQNPLQEHTPSEIELSTELYKRLHELNIPFSTEVAVHNLGEEIHFYISAPRRHIHIVSKIIETLWPTSYVTKADSYDLLLEIPTNQNTAIAAGYITQVHPYAVPIKKSTRKSNEMFLPILQELSKLSTLGEGAAIQWIMQPAHAGIARQIAESVKKIENGTYNGDKHLHEEFLLTKETLAHIKSKVSSPLFAVNARIIAGAHSLDGAKTILSRLSGIINQETNKKTYNNLSVVTPKKQEGIIQDFFGVHFQESQTMILSAEEIATVFHFPGPYTPVPKLKRS